MFQAMHPQSVKVVEYHQFNEVDIHMCCIFYVFIFIDCHCQFHKIGAILGAKNHDIHLHKTLKIRTDIDYIFGCTP
jgi:hypothetical protein